MIENYIWKSKINQVAHNTIIAKYKHGGLNLVDIETKKYAFRLKIIKNLLSKDEYIWKNYIIALLDSCGRCGLYNLCQTLPQSHYSKLDPFMKEVMEAWERVRPLFKTDIKRAATALPQCGDWMCR